MLKKIRLTIYNHSLISCLLLLFLFIFYVSYSIYQKEDLTSYEKMLKNSLANIANIFTLKVKVDYKEVEKSFSDEKEKELESLKALLNLENNSSYSLVHAGIITRNLNYFDTLTLDKGKKDGLDQGMLAINENGLIGVVEYVTKDTAVVSLITREVAKYKIGVKVESNGNIYNGILTGYDSNKQELIVESIRNQSDIGEGGIISTNGLSKTYPPNIIIGTLTSIETDTTGMGKKLKVKPSVDFQNIKYLSIIKGETHANN